MDNETELQTARDEVYKGIGRNLLLFQRAEHMLKHLNTIGAVSGISSNLKDNLTKQKAAFHEQTMGSAMNHFLDNLGIGKDPLAEPFEDTGETILSWSFTNTESDADAVAHKLAQETIVAERNHLVHQMFVEFDSDSLTQCLELAVKLDEQRERILPEFRRLGEHLVSVREGMKCIFEFLNSPEGMAWLRFPSMRDNSVVKALIALAAPNAQPDGWTSLQAAGNLIGQQSPGCLSAELAQFESKSLSGLVLASHLFDLKHAATDAGGTRAFYRVKDP